MTARTQRRGWLIAVEGIDGAGKSTLVRALGAALRRRGWSVKQRREPTDPVLGRLAQTASVRDPWTGGVYFTVDRHLARRSLARDLAGYDIVLADRSFYSTLAYQGSALPPRDRRRLEQLQRRSTIVPDRVVLLDIDPSDAIRRLSGRALHRGPLERRSVLCRVARAYRGFARRHGWIVVDARLSTRAVVQGVLARLDPILPRVRRRGRLPSLRRRR